jgi:endonuclease YncB( thermonuclease family)
MSCIPCYKFSFYKKQQELDPELNPELDDSKMNRINTNIIKWDDTTEFTFPIHEGIVIKVYDGDTFTLATKIPALQNSPLYRFPVRLAGIDAPEIKTNNTDEKIMAFEARDALANLILYKKITLKNIRNEKYGRVLADAYLEDLHINHWLLKERYVVPYDGNTKYPPRSWIEYRHKD